MSMSCNEENLLQIQSYSLIMCVIGCIHASLLSADLGKMLHVALDPTEATQFWIRAPIFLGMRPASGTETP